MKHKKYLKNEILIFFILVFSFFSLIEGKDNCELSVINILTKNVSSEGFLIIETDRQIPTFQVNLDDFALSIANEGEDSVISLSCFLFTSVNLYSGTTLIACSIGTNNKIKTGKYHLVPLKDEIYIDFDESRGIIIPPFNMKESFEIISGEELNFYIQGNDVYERFDDYSDQRIIGFELFKDTYLKELTIYFDNIKILCRAAGPRVRCPIKASMFPQEKRYNIYKVYFEDSQGNKKENFFVTRAFIFLNYIDKKPLKIKVTKLLTNSLSTNDYIVVDTTDNYLEPNFLTDLYINLEVKKEGNTKSNNLQCFLHKHPGETTKLFCFVGDDSKFEEGTYSFEQYLSPGAIEDEEDNISHNYEITIPTFKLTGTFEYKNEDYHDLIYEAIIRDKIILNYNSKEEIRYLVYSCDERLGKVQYYLGDYKLNCFDSPFNLIVCEVPGNLFPYSGTYYFQRMNLLGHLERLYFMSPIEVIVTWK